MPQVPTLRFFVTPLSALLVAVTLSGARADDAATVTVPQLQTMVGNMGLTDSGDKKSYVSVDHQGGRDLTVTLQPVEDGKYLSFYTGLGAIPTDKLAIAPSEKMLEWNDTHRFYFTIGGDDTKTGYLQTRIEAASVSPKTLRDAIDQLIEAVDETKDLWDQDGWKGAKSGAIGSGETKDYKSLQDEADAAWAAAPLKIKTAVLTKDKVPGFGEYEVRDSSAFKNNEVMHLYLEPVFYAWKPETDGKSSIDLTADILIKTVTGSVVLDQKGFLHLATAASAKLKTVDMVANVTLEDSLAATNYVVTMTVHDQVGKKTASADVPFSIVKP